MPCYKFFYTTPLGLAILNISTQGSAPLSGNPGLVSAIPLGLVMPSDYV